ncbi:Hypothetical protein CKL_3834 [Clostridium kluyveri DSM 555]|uniref:Uncharacterized protein n=1 Tax=Clostridium kluyveri (strain ATCC 8527 / DSM 555 / NBRC 12016 / NCIMB 10680 / K1) TaxID=431943 RepID=A5N3W5_CLOK5|nr:Hypothetical protein CKL_3834 [Clostridium kluyveri DSM 555]
MRLPPFPPAAGNFTKFIYDTIWKIQQITKKIKLKRLDFQLYFHTIRLCH